MRRPTTIETLYLDFDGFFASVMQQAMPELRGRAVGVIPFETTFPHRTVVIACSKEAKAAGCKNVMPVPEALALCPDLVLVPQRPDLFRRAHNALLNEIACEIPIDTVKSIDELCCRLDPGDIAAPRALAARIKDRIAANIGSYITCSIGFAANRLQAKIACKVDKPNGVTIWTPDDAPLALAQMTFESIPGIGPRMQRRLETAGVSDMACLLATQPKELRALWGNVNGERMWYALHGYALSASDVRQHRGMYGHGRVLPPVWRSLPKAEDCSRMLLTKAARRMRRDGFSATRLHLWLHLGGRSWGAETDLREVIDDHACLSGLTTLWGRARAKLSVRTRVLQVGVMLGGLRSAQHRQLDLLERDDPDRRRWEAITHAMDGLNSQFGKRVVTLGPWMAPPGGFAGGKIAFTRIPSAEDFW